MVITLRIAILALLGVVSTARAANPLPTTQGTPSTVPSKPLVVFVTGDHEYRGEQTLPILARELQERYGFQTLVLRSVNDNGEPDPDGETNIPGLEALKRADVAVFFLRWRRLPKAQTDLIQQYLDSGRPVMGFRTSTHAFNYPKGHELERWNAFGQFALGGPPGWGSAVGGDKTQQPTEHTHYGHASSTDVTVAPGEEANPLLSGVPKQFHVRSWLYQVAPDYPPKGSQVLLVGKAVNPDKKAIENPVAWTWKNAAGGRVFTTTMGHPDDFQSEGFHRLVINAIHWLAGKPAPSEAPFTPDEYKGIQSGMRSPTTRPTTGPTTAPATQPLTAPSTTRSA